MSHSIGYLLHGLGESHWRTTFLDPFQLQDGSEVKSRFLGFHLGCCPSWSQFSELTNLESFPVFRGLAVVPRQLSDFWYFDDAFTTVLATQAKPSEPGDRHCSILLVSFHVLWSVFSFLALCKIYNMLDLYRSICLYVIHLRIPAIHSSIFRSP